LEKILRKGPGGGGYDFKKKHLGGGKNGILTWGPPGEGEGWGDAGKKKFVKKKASYRIVVKRRKKVQAHGRGRGEGGEDEWVKNVIS